MANKIEFLDNEPSYDFDADSLTFRCRVDGKALVCVVTAEFLMTNFGAMEYTEEEMRRAYREHKSEIQLIARDHIENGRIDLNGRVVLTTRFTRLIATSDKRFSEWADVQSAAETVLQLLKEIIGPNAEKVVVDLRAVEQPPGPPTMSLDITDASMPFRANTLLGPREWQDHSTLAIIVAGAWGNILRARSRKLLLRSG